MTPHPPRLALTLGDVAGIGPEVVLKACADPGVRSLCRPVLVGHPDLARRAATLIGLETEIFTVDSLAEISEASGIPCFDPAGDDVLEVSPGSIDARAGHAAYESLAAATSAALAGHVDGIVTAPLNKKSLHLGGHIYPGHTEILAELCGIGDFAMMLYLPPGDEVRSERGLGVAHVTLHQSLASVPAAITIAAVREKIRLVDDFLRRLDGGKPRIGVCALNPHAGENGLFGHEEITKIAPAVAAEQDDGINVSGPFPADTLLKRAVAAEFDGVVAMYHDQGHIALKLIGFDRAVNVTLGLPIVRTSPSHGTAFDIAWQGNASAAGFLEAIQVAARLASLKNRPLTTDN